MATETIEGRAALSPAEAAAALGCSRNHIYNLAARGELKFVKLGHRTLVPASEIRRLAEEGTGGA